MIKQRLTAVICFALSNNVMKPDLNHVCRHICMYMEQLITVGI